MIEEECFLCTDRHRRARATRRRADERRSVHRRKHKRRTGRRARQSREEEKEEERGLRTLNFAGVVRVVGVRGGRVGGRDGGELISGRSLEKVGEAVGVEAFVELEVVARGEEIGETVVGVDLEAAQDVDRCVQGRMRLQQLFEVFESGLVHHFRERDLVVAYFVGVAFDNVAATIHLVVVSWTSFAAFGLERSDGGAAAGGRAGLALPEHVARLVVRKADVRRNENEDGSVVALRRVGQTCAHSRFPHGRQPREAAQVEGHRPVQAGPLAGPVDFVRARRIRE
mmetsp:Transcript_30634/g.93630  ORF Transcript_30634/g.93630 Transcript_30634/m.93630 type:complete len:284 (+) Transcript_30634:893-1744(+)